MARGGARAEPRQSGGIYAAGENAVSTNLTAEQLIDVLGQAGASTAGVQVTAETAMRVATVYACVSLIAGAVSTLPVGVFERVGPDRQQAEHPYWWLLNEQACEEFTSAAAWEALVMAKLFYGDGFAELLRPSAYSSRVIGWRPLQRWQVLPFRSDGHLMYRVSDDAGGLRTLTAADMIHVPSLGFDGVCSPSPITYAAREAIGTAIAAENFSAKFFTGGAGFDYAVKTAKNLTAKDLEDLRTSLVARAAVNRHGGRAPLILSGGLEPATMSWNPRDSEIMATRVLGVQEICRALGVPPHMVGHTEKSTSWGSGIAEQGMGFVRYTLRRHLTPIAQEFNRKLWPTRERYFVEHVTSALESGDMKSRYEAYRVALGRAGETPFITADEIRRWENMKPGVDLQPNGGAGAQQTVPAAG